MTQDQIENAIAKIDIELCIYLSNNDIPYKLTNIFEIETTNCTEKQKDKILEIEEKKRPLLAKMKNI